MLIIIYLYFSLGVIEAEMNQIDIGFKATSTVLLTTRLRSEQRDQELDKYVAVRREKGSIQIQARLPDEGYFVLDMYAKEVLKAISHLKIYFK